MISKQIYKFLREALFSGIDREEDDAQMARIVGRSTLSNSSLKVGDLVYLKYRNPEKPYAAKTSEHLAIISGTSRMPSGYGINLSTKNRLVAAYSIVPSNAETLKVILGAIYKNRSVTYGKGVVNNLFSSLFGPRRFRTFIQNRAFDIHKIDFRSVDIEFDTPLED